MPRKYQPTERFLEPNPRHGNLLLSKFINCVMYSGKKSTARREVYAALDIIREKMHEEDPVKVFTDAVENVKPQVEVRSNRVGGATYQVPVEVRQDRRVALAMRWLIEYASARGEKMMQEKLAGEIIDAANNRGNAVLFHFRYSSIP